MKRFATLGLLLASAAAGSAGNPVSVNPPAAPASGSGLSQSLPSAIQSAVPNAPAPALVSQPSWGAEPLFSSQAIPTTGPTYLTNPTVGCAPCETPAVRPHFNLLAFPARLSAPTACGGCGVRGSCLDRLKAWLSFQPTPSGVPVLEPIPYRVPLRAYFPCTPDGGAGAGGCAAGGGCGPKVRPNVLARLGLFQGKGACEATIPTRPLPPAPACDADGRTRVVYVPLTADGCADGKACSPTLWNRLTGKLTGGSCAAGGGCATGNCPPPPPSPVRFAAPCTLPYYGSTPPPVHQQQGVPTVVPAQPVTTNGKAVPTQMPPASGSGTKTSAAPVATQPFTNP